MDLNSSVGKLYGHSSEFGLFCGCFPDVIFPETPNILTVPLSTLWNAKREGAAMAMDLGCFEPLEIGCHAGVRPPWHLESKGMLRGIFSSFARRRALRRFPMLPC
jgi:hypothetical protein